MLFLFSKTWVLAREKLVQTRAAIMAKYSPLALELMQQLEMKDRPAGEVYAETQLDIASDREEDEASTPIPGCEKVGVGKYFLGKRKTTHTLKMIYEEDKDYLDWVRSHVDPKKSGVAMKRLRLYVECRDQAKKERLMKKYAMEHPPKLTEDNDQMPVVPKAAKEKRRPREGEGWGTPFVTGQMELEEWEPVDGPPTIEQMMMRAAQAKAEHEILVKHMEMLAQKEQGGKSSHDPK